MSFTLPGFDHHRRRVPLASEFFRHLDAACEIELLVQDG